MLNYPLMDAADASLVSLAELSLNATSRDTRAET